MAISKVYINGDHSALKSFLEASGLFETVDLFSTTITCKDANDNVICTFSGINNALVLTTYYANGVSPQNMSYSNLSGKIDYAYLCANGVMLNVERNESSGGRLGTIILTKTNNNEVAVVYTASSYMTASAKYTPYHAICLSDVSPLSEFEYSLHAGNQTKIVAFSTNNDLDTTSFTPNAGYMPVGQNYDMGYGKFTFDGAIWLTNGYWAIKDGAAE